MKGSVKEPNKFHNYETEKITHVSRCQNVSILHVVGAKSDGGGEW